MNTFFPTEDNLSIPLAYPGITVESIPGTQNIYEVVWNCGSISALMTTLSDESIRNSSFTLLASMFEDIRKLYPKIIFITDEKIFQDNPLIQTLFQEIFGAGNYRFIFTQKSQPEKNQLSGLRINRSEFTSIDDAKNVLIDLADAPVISSIPYSDPRIDRLLNEYLAQGGNEGSLSIQSLRLLMLNSKKSNQQLVASEAIGFLGSAQDSEGLAQIFSDNPNTALVVKEDESAAGGTSVNFVYGEEQRKKVIAEKLNFPILVYTFFTPTIITNKQEQNFPIQLRPYFTLTGRFAGGCLKIPQRPMKNRIGFIEGSGRRTFQEQNESLNTSSGLTQSFFFDDTGKWIAGFRGIGEVLDANTINQLLQDFSIKGEKISTELLKKWAIGIQPLTQNIQVKTCSLLGIINNK